MSDSGKKRPGRPRKKRVKRLLDGTIDRLGPARKRKYTPRIARYFKEFNEELEPEYVEVFAPWIEMFIGEHGDFFHFFFGNDSRQVNVYRVEEPMQLGGYAELLNKYKAWDVSDNPRYLHKGDFVLVRIDNRQPFEFTIQILRKAPNIFVDTCEDRVFTISPRDFHEQIRKNVSLSGNRHRDTVND